MYYWVIIALMEVCHDSSGRLASVSLGVVREGFTEKVRHELTFEGGI